jgi:hypothetical protein
MRIVINEKLIKRNKLIGQITTFSSLAILGIGLVLAFKKDTTRILLSYLALIVGFIVSQIGIYFTNRFGRSPRFDELILKNFEKLGSEYTLYIYSSPVPILLVGPCGMWIPLPILASGKVSYLKGKWKQQGGSAMMKAFAQEGIGRPDNEEINNLRDLTKYLKSKNVPESEIPEIQTILVLLNEKTEIGDVSEAPTEIVHLRKLKLHIRQHDRNCSTLLTEEQLAKLNFYFSKE